MPIGQKSRKQVKTVRVLADADPRRVSLVDHGANQTPFREVKADLKNLGNTAKTEKENTMPKDITQKSGAELVKVSFSKSKFASEDDVKKWMTEKGYSEPSSIENSESAFTVTAPEFSATKADNMRVVEAEDGVTYTLSKSADDTADGTADGEDDTSTTTKSDGGAQDDVDDEPEEDDEDAEGDDADESLKAANAEVVKELTEKVNQMRVYYSDKSGMKDVLKEADDGMPIGVGDLFGLFSKALENAARSGDSDTVKSVSAEFGSMFTEMMDITNKFIAGAKSDSKVDTTSKSADAPEPKVSDEDGTVVADATVAPTEEEKAANLLKEVQSTLEEQVAKAATQAQDSLNTAMKEVTELVTTLTSEVKSLTARISDLESTEQTRKGADDEAGKAPSTAKKSEMSALEKNIWGFR